MWAVLDTGTPTKWKKLTTGWPGDSHDIICHNSENLPQKIGNKLALVLKINCAKTITVTGQTTQTNFEMTVRADCADVYSSLLPIEALAQLPTGCRRDGLWTECSPMPQ